MVSVFFEVGDEESEFLSNIGFNPIKNPKISDVLHSLSDNEELSLENTVLNLKSVKIISLT